MASSFDAIQPNYRTEEMLEAWGRWSNSSAKGISIFGVIMQIKTGSVLKAAFRITDDEALKVDKAVAELKIRDMSAYHIIVEVFRYRRSISSLERSMLIPRRDIDAIINRSIGFIDGRLFNMSGI